MKPDTLFSKGLIQYILKFLFAFCFFYGGITLWIGLCSPGGYYSQFIQEHLDFISLLRNSILYTSKYFLSLLGYPVELVGEYNIKLVNGWRVHLVYSCLGYGVMSFWAAFIIANKGSFKRKFIWVTVGLLALWLINVSRISALVLARNNKTNIFHWISHHTMFNIVAYLLIFFMMYLFDRFSADKIKDAAGTE